MNIFVSYTSSDKKWAQWIGWQLRAVGHEPFVHDWEIGAGENIARWMEQRFKQADRLIGVFSDAYCDANYSQSERWAAYWKDPRGDTGFLAPVEVSRVNIWPDLVRPLKRLSLIGMDEAEASAELLAFLQPPRFPIVKPPFPGSSVTAPIIATPFTEGGEPLSSTPPTFPAGSPVENKPVEGEIPIRSPMADPNLGIRCINDHEPEPQIFGRDEEFETIINALLEGKMVLVAGGPGMGKTAVATAAFYDKRVIEYFGRRRVFASLETATEPRAILAKLVETLGLPPTGDEISLLRIIEAAAAEMPIAAILDNAETVLDVDHSASERLLSLVAHIPGLSLAVTMRGVAPPIPNAVQIYDLPKLNPPAAQEAFLAIAGNSFGRDTNLTPLLEALDGHALSIRLVAAQAIGSPSLDGLRESWDEAHAEILRTSGQEEGRLTSVRASLALSLESKRMKSTPLARRLMSILAFLPGGLADSDVRSQLGDRGVITKVRANEAVGCLHQLRLVENRPDRRLRVLTPLRETVKDDVALMAGDQQRLIDRYLSIATKAFTIGGRDWEKHHEEVESEADNLDPVCELAVARDLSNKRLPAALFGLIEFHTFSGRGEVGSVDRAVDRLRQETPSPFLARCIFGIGNLARMRSNNEVARSCFEESLALNRGLKDAINEARCVFCLGDLARVQSDNKRACEYLERALKGFHRVESAPGEADCIKALSDIERSRGNYGSAREQLETALALYRRVGALGGEANVIHALGDAARQCSDYEEARSQLERALEIYRRIGSVGGIANCLQSLGELFRASFEDAAAQTHLNEALVLHQRVGSLMGEANCNTCLAEIARVQLEYQTARARLDQALILFERIKLVAGQAVCLKARGDIARASGDRETAIKFYQRSHFMYRQAEDTRGEAETMIRLGQLQISGPDPIKGMTNIRDGFVLYFESASNVDLAIRGWRDMHLALTSNDPNKTKEYLESAKRSWLIVKRSDLIFDWITSATQNV